MSLSLSRSLIYQFLSKLFLYPEALYSSEEKDSFSKAVEFYASHSSDDLASKLIEHGRSLLDLIERLSFEELQAEHRNAFGHTLSKECPPYETQYGSDLIFQQTQRMADISAFYKAFGLMISDSAKERHDHVSVEFEFMAFLSYKEEYALRHHGQKDVQVCQEAQKGFMKSHLISWMPSFAIHLRKRAQNELYGSFGLYKNAANFVDIFLRIEAKSLQIPTESLEMRELKLISSISFRPDQVNGNCFSCDINDITS